MLSEKEIVEHMTTKEEDGAGKELAAMYKFAKIIVEQLDPAQRERVIRWCCEVFDIQSYPQHQDYDQEPLFTDPKSVKSAKNVMRVALREDASLNTSYSSKVAALIYDEIKERAGIKLIREDTHLISDRVLHIIFSD
jgi:hypothetical protein